jgi:ribosomal biogenesis protein LAS1
MLGSEKHQRVLGDIIEASFMQPTEWNLKLADALLEDKDLPIQNREDWVAIISATRGDASSEVEMEVDVDKAEEAEEVKEENPVILEEKTEVIEPVVKEKISGPQKFIGLWKPRPIGWLVDDEPDD